MIIHTKYNVGDVLWYARFVRDSAGEVKLTSTRLVVHRILVNVNRDKTISVAYVGAGILAPSVNEHQCFKDKDEALTEGRVFLESIYK